MKRMFALLLAILMMGALLAGCGSSDKEPDQGTVTPVATEAAQEKPLSLGRLEGGTYTNEYVGIQCSLDSAWTYYSAEELQDLPEAVKNAMEGSELSEAMADTQQITVMMAENVDELLSMNILYTKLDMQQRMAYAMMSQEDVVDGTLSQEAMLVESYAMAGIEVSAIEKVRFNFLGEECVGIHTTATTQGVPYYVLQVADYSLGQYGVTISLCSYVEDNTAAMLELFTALD